MEQFVQVRMVQGNGIDLSVFQFDYESHLRGILYECRQNDLWSFRYTH